jgi:hypothetical protein
MSDVAALDGLLLKYFDLSEDAPFFRLAQKRSSIMVISVMKVFVKHRFLLLLLRIFHSVSYWKNAPIISGPHPDRVENSPCLSTLCL